MSRSPLNSAMASLSVALAHMASLSPTDLLSIKLRCIIQLEIIKLNTRETNGPVCTIPKIHREPQFDVCDLPRKSAVA